MRPRVALLVCLAGISLCRAKKCTLPTSHPNVIEETMLPMSDGTKLHTLALSPDPLDKSKRWPTVIDRSPYGMFNTELIADLFLIFDFAAVSQDLRGCCQSEGNFSLFHDERRDGSETIDWITKQPWSDGQVFIVGGSADAIAGLELVRAALPAVKAGFFIFGTAEARATFFPGGAWRESLTHKWLNGTVPAQYPQLLDAIFAHEGDGPWWDTVETKGAAQFGRVTWPAVHWAGWYDIFLEGHLETFEGFHKLAAPEVRSRQYLVVDPLGHCQDADRYFPRHLVIGRAALPILLGVWTFLGAAGRSVGAVPEAVEAVDQARHDDEFYDV